ncbi:MAG: hypothetical protein SFW36_14645, partial [Leptolyngbyaceae cyanobacterium bins.59]|nr:hypothetical protein [Leptolyngbyaceae cyanobacterium bins.59]
MKSKLGKKRITLLERGKQKKTVTQSAFEDFNALAGFAQLNLKGRSVGTAILQKSKNRYQFVFGFTSNGIHDTLRSEQIKPTLSKLESALKELPSGGHLTFHLQSFRDDRDRQMELDDLLQKAPSPELRLLLMSEKSRAQELKAAGIRKPKHLQIYATYSIEPNQKTASNADWIEKSLAKLVEFWEVFKGKGDEVAEQRLEDMLHRVLIEGYLRWEQLLNIKMGLDVKPMDVNQLWNQIWSRFNLSPAPDVPQYLLLNQQGLSEIVSNDVHPATMLIQGEHGRTTVPKADRQWIKVKGKY